METDYAGGRKSREGGTDGSSAARGLDVLFLLCCGRSAQQRYTRGHSWLMRVNITLLGMVAVLRSISTTAIYRRT